MMREQTINTCSINFDTDIWFKRARIFAITLLACIVSACIPVRDQGINTELFKSKEDMKERTATLKAGMPIKTVFEKLEIDRDKFTRLSTQEVQMSIYGNSQVQGTPDQLERFRDRLMCYEGFSLPYKEVKGSGSLGFGSLKVNKSGYDLKLVLIFDKGKLMRASIDGNQEVNMNEDESLFNVLLRRGTGVSF